MRHKPSPSLTYLGRPTPAPTTPDEAVLDRVPNPHADLAYAVRFSAPEFTVLCAVTGQSDFAHFIRSVQQQSRQCGLGYRGDGTRRTHRR
jgi:NADPH-dependent 7-cyano-7-deazaguanine reductase QueF